MSEIYGILFLSLAFYFENPFKHERTYFKYIENTKQSFDLYTLLINENQVI